jgi:hypothetical protein
MALTSLASSYSGDAIGAFNASVVAATQAGAALQAATNAAADAKKALDDKGLAWEVSQTAYDKAIDTQKRLAVLAAKLILRDGAVSLPLTLNANFSDDQAGGAS